MSDTLTQREYSSLKASLTRVIKSGDHAAIGQEAVRAFAIFAAKGWPDDWSRWQRAADDAAFALARSC